mmetsp:Transcript_29240/g.47185  ORF Transcript_29240/g.47185 Transcript_29240/m.47185 type:complete len:235 (-) Transcript_29240:268-972(-)
MIFVIRIDEVLDLRKAEFTDANEARARGDLVSKTNSDLSSRERNSAAVVLEKTLEIHEHTLCGFGTKIPGSRSGRTDRRLEHKVEREGIREVVSGVGSLYLKLAKLLCELVLRIRACLGSYAIELFFIGVGSRRIINELRRSFLKKLVCTVTVLCNHVANHQIVELLDVARGLQDNLGREIRAVYLKHALFENKMLSPQSKQVCFDRTSRGTKVVQSTNAAIDLEGRGDEIAAF